MNSDDDINNNNNEDEDEDDGDYQHPHPHPDLTTTMMKMTMTTSTTIEGTLVAKPAESPPPSVRTTVVSNNTQNSMVNEDAVIVEVVVDDDNEKRESHETTRTRNDDISYEKTTVATTTTTKEELFVRLLHNTADTLEYLQSKARANWFVLGIVVSVCLAALFPRLGKSGGSLHPEILNKLIVGFIFFASGICLPIKELRNALSRVRLHLFVQGFNLGLVPLLMFLFVLVLKIKVFHFEKQLLEGLIVLACLPTTVGSSVLFTKMAFGNEAAALFNSTIGNLLGVFFSPLLILLLTTLISSSNATASSSHPSSSSGHSSSSSAILSELGDVLKDLCMTVLLPLLAGQVTRYLVPLWVISKPPWGSLSSCGILVIVYSVFCNTFSMTTTISTQHILSVALLVVTSHLLFLCLCWNLSSLPFLRLSPDDRVATLFCGTQKTMALGIGLINIIYPNQNISFVLLPLLFYHPTQMLVSGILVGPLGRWTEETKQQAGLHQRLIQREEEVEEGRRQRQEQPQQQQQELQIQTIEGDSPPLPAR